jgi:hypothetical protein
MVPMVFLSVAVILAIVITLMEITKHEGEWFC